MVLLRRFMMSKPDWISSWLSLPQPCNPITYVELISKLVCFPYAFIVFQLCVCGHFGHLVHHFQSLDIFFTVIVYCLSRTQNMTEIRKLIKKKKKKNNAASPLIKKNYWYAIDKLFNNLIFLFVQVITINTINTLTPPFWNQMPAELSLTHGAYPLI